MSNLDRARPGRLPTKGATGSVSRARHYRERAARTAPPPAAAPTTRCATCGASTTTPARMRERPDAEPKILCRRCAAAGALAGWTADPQGA